MSTPVYRPSQMPGDAAAQPAIAVVIPCYRVGETIAEVLRAVGPEVDWIICVDDASPDGCARVVGEAAERDRRIHLIRHGTNLGVGGATCTGYVAALRLGAEVIVKIDGDGQMDPRLVPRIVAPILRGDADYVKGNRFFSMDTVRQMSFTRKLGNAGLSFMNKLSTGYWDLFDPTNGYTAIEARVAAALPLQQVSQRYFFESDMLFRLSTLRARVVELPMAGVYRGAPSSLSEANALLTFPFLHARNFAKRLAYMYFLRGFSMASISLLAGSTLSLFGIWYGLSAWVESYRSGIAATPGTVMLAAMPILLGIQMLLSFLAHDVAMTPRSPIHEDMDGVTVMRAVDVESLPHLLDREK